MTAPGRRVMKESRRELARMEQEEIINLYRNDQEMIVDVFPAGRVEA